MKAEESPSAPVQYHPPPQPTSMDNSPGVVEAEVSPPKRSRGFSKRFLRNKPVITRKELDDGLKSCSEEVRSAALKLYMLISSGKFTKKTILQEEQKFLEASYTYQIQETLKCTPVSDTLEFTQPSLPEILLALKSRNAIYRKKAINVYRAILSMTDMGDPFYQEAATSFHRAKRDYIEAIRLVDLGVLDANQTALDKPKETGPKIIGAITIGEGLWKALNCNDPYLKHLAGAYYDILTEGVSLNDHKLTYISERFRKALDTYNAKLKAQMEYMKKTKIQDQTLF